jgi:hypothetical protein
MNKGLAKAGPFVFRRVSEPVSAIPNHLDAQHLFMPNGQMARIANASLARSCERTGSWGPVAPLRLKEDLLCKRRPYEETTPFFISDDLEKTRERGNINFTSLSSSLSFGQDCELVLLKRKALRLLVQGRRSEGLAPEVLLQKPNFSCPCRDSSKCCVKCRI